MTPDEIIRELREDADWCDANEYEIPLCMGDNQREAADLIESMQAKISESQRREQAAVADLNGLARFEKERCAYCLHDEECEPGEMLCSYKGDKAFEWRGTLEAEKGAADGN